MGLREKLPEGEARLFCGEELLDSALFALGGGEVAIYSRRNPGRESENEDSAAIVAARNEGGVLVVADGLGGAPAGQHASATAVAALVDAVREAALSGRELRHGILNGFDRANEKVLALGLGAATTLTVAEVRAGTVRAYHVGDSFLLVTGNRGKIKMQTISHSPVGYGVESGLLDAADAMHHEERHFVSNVIGSSGMHIEIGPPVDLARHDTLVLGSDGLSDNLHTSEIVTSVRKGPLGRASRELARKARERMEASEGSEPSKPDDVTFVIYRLRNERRPLTPP